MMTNDDEKECTDSGIGSGIGTLSGDHSNYSADNSSNESCVERNNHPVLPIKENFVTTTSTPKSSRNGTQIDPVGFDNATFLFDIRCAEPRRYVLRSVTKVAPTNHLEPHTNTIRELYDKNKTDATIETETDLEDSVFEIIEDDANDVSYVVGSNTMSNKSKTVAFLDLNYDVIVEDESHVASDEDLGEKSGRRTPLKTVKTTSSNHNETNANHTKTKRKLWTPNSYKNFDDQPPVDPDDHVNRSVQLNSESKQIKLKVPIPTYLIPVKFQKNKTNENYSPLTSNVLSTPKSIFRKVQLSCTTKFPDKICGFFESLDAAIVPAKFSDPNALYYRNNYMRKRDFLLSRLVILYDQKVFDGKLCDEAVSVAWVKYTLKTEANCEFRKRGDIHTAAIKLNDNIATASQLRDCLIAELCRAAAWVLSENDELEMGWKKWAEQANERIPDLPLIQFTDHYEFVCECNVCNLSSFARYEPNGVEKIICVHCHGPITFYLNQKDVYGKLVASKAKMKKK